MARSTQAPSPAVQRRGRRDLLAVIVLGIIPVIWFGLPAALGHPQVPGDDFTQNFPIRVLVGQQLRHGVLPLYDPYIWSGTPLLGGWNAGALYPFTFLFAVMPGTLAWTINEIVVYVVAAIGLYAFLRAVGRRPISSAVGGAAFAFAGAMDVHLTHFGLVAGTSWAPWVLLCMVKLARPGTFAGRLRWTALLAVAGALVILAGEPRAIDTVIIVSIVFFVWTVIRDARPAALFVAAVAAGLAVAVLIGAVQWLPGATAVSTSQRAARSYALYGSGSLPWHWLSLMLVPGTLGGSGSFGTASWFAGYNLPEVMGYAGLFPVAAAFGLLGTLRRGRRMPEWLIWQVILVIGILLALGSFTPLGHVFVHLPFFGNQRLQSRNIAIADLALPVLLAYGLDELLDRHGTAAPSGTRWKPSRFEVFALVPLVATVVIAVAGAISPATVARLADASANEARYAAPQRPLFIVSALLAAALGALVVLGHRITLRRVVGLVVVFVTADLVFFNITSVWSVAPGLGGSPSPAVSAFPPGTSPVPLGRPVPLGTTGRFAIYDPNSIDESSLFGLGAPDLNVLQGTYSVQGYSSIVDGPYAQATGSHAATGFGTNALTPAALVNGVFDSLDTTTLVTLPSELAVPAAPSTPISPTSRGRRTVGAGGLARWVFGEQLEVASVSVPWKADAAGRGAPALRVGLEAPDGTIVWQHPTVTTSSPGMVRIELPRAAAGVGMVLVPARAGDFGPPSVLTAPGTSYSVSGPLEDALGLVHWSFDGDSGPFAYFTNDRARPPLTVRSLGGAPIGNASVRARSGPLLEPASARVSSPHGAEVIRAVAAIRGWTATWTPVGAGASRALPMRTSGVVQAVDVPAGRGVVTWEYSAPGLAVGTWCAAAGVAGLVALWLAPSVTAGRRRRRGAGAHRRG